MISRIVGRLTQMNERGALIENMGIFYEVRLPSGLAEKLKDENRVGEEISFETIYYIERRDLQTLVPIRIC